MTVPLHQAAASGNLPALQKELDSGVDINMPNEGELSVRSALIHQVSNCSYPSVRAEGWTALHHSIANGHLSASEVLLESGADANLHHFGTLLAFSCRQPLSRSPNETALPPLTHIVLSMQGSARRCMRPPSAMT